MAMEETKNLCVQILVALHNKIMIDGKGVSVSEEVFRAYSQMDRRERYQEEQQGNHPQVSLDRLRENHVPLDLYIKKHALSAEEMLLQKEDKEEAE